MKLETKPGIKHEMTVTELQAALRLLPDDTVLLVDLSMFIKEKEEPHERKKT